MMTKIYTKLIFKKGERKRHSVIDEDFLNIDHTLKFRMRRPKLSHPEWRRSDILLVKKMICFLRDFFVKLHDFFYAFITSVF